MSKSPKDAKKVVEATKHYDATRLNIPTAEHQSVVQKSEQAVKTVTYPRDAAGLEAEKEGRERDLDPQLVWRGKDAQDWSDLVVQAPPLYIQEKVSPKALIDDLMRRKKAPATEEQPDLFGDFNGIPEGADKTDFYQHEGHWSNRMILGDSLQVMASLAEREGLRGKVQCIYLDPPYGIKFNSNFQWSTTSRDVKDGNAAHITREPEQVKAFRDTWRDGIHSYLTYLRDRLTVARDLLHDTGSIFVQIGDENVHRVRALLDEVFGDQNAIVTIYFRKTATQSGDFLADTNDYLLWYAKDKAQAKFRPLQQKREGFDWVNYDYVMSKDLRFRKLSKGEKQGEDSIDSTDRVYRRSPLTSTSASASTLLPFDFEGRSFSPGKGGWKTNPQGIQRLSKSFRIETYGTTASFRRFTSDFPFFPLSNSWIDTASGGYGADKTYVVQTNTKVIERCVLLTTDPGDLVIDPTCGSGTTATVAEQWGRRWITIDTSRVALALARARIMGARYPNYLLSDSAEGLAKESEIQKIPLLSRQTLGNIRHGFVYERAPHITLKSIANNSEIDTIWEKSQATLSRLLSDLNAELNNQWRDWEVPRDSEHTWSERAIAIHQAWWLARISLQREIDASIFERADMEFLYDKPYEGKNKVRVAGPFTVESLSPHRTHSADGDESRRSEQGGESETGSTHFLASILENLRTSGVQQAHKEDKIVFNALTPWPGSYVCAEGRYDEGGVSKRAGVFIGPEFGTVSRPDLVAAAREAGDADFDVLIACAFNYDAHSSEFGKLGRIPVLKARMNADLHMADDLKNTGKGNLFVVFGEPDLDVLEAEGGEIRVRLNGVDVFKPQLGKVESSGPDEIACWFVDTDYDEESFFVRHAYFLGANDPYKALKTTLKAEIDPDAWATLNRDVSRPFPRPASGRIAVKVINHLGDEVMKVFRV